MPKALINGVNLFHEVVGEGMPLIFVHEFAGESQSWRPQVNFFSRRYRTITYNAAPSRSTPAATRRRTFPTIRRPTPSSRPWTTSRASWIT